MEPDLDAWLAEPRVRTSHTRVADADPDALWRAAAEVRLRDTPVLGRAVRWRIPGTSPDSTFEEVLRTYPFVALAAGPRWSASGICGRLWTLRRDYPHLHGLDDFLAWEEPGTVRVLLAHRAEPLADGRAQLVSEARIAAVDRSAAFRLRALWATVGRLERLVGTEALRVAARRAEADG